MVIITVLTVCRDISDVPTSVEEGRRVGYGKKSVDGVGSG